MARVDVRLPNTVIDALNQVGNVVENNAEQILSAGASVVEPRLRANLTAAIGRGTKAPSRSTGQLVSALGTTAVKVNSRGVYNVKVGFAENRRDGRSNALIANVLEHGRSNQAARPFLTPTRSQTRKPAQEAMKTALTTVIEQVKP
ncbi:MAG: HK97 gp10 family phage protein [Actinomycetaceae bacterium]|nr:HK97 gp10 family phage protein [Actinomycetaceae bacterium]